MKSTLNHVQYFKALGIVVVYSKRLTNRTFPVKGNKGNLCFSKLKKMSSVVLFLVLSGSKYRKGEEDANISFG